MTPEQVNDVLRVSAGTRDYVIFRLGFLLGLRPGELRALKWHHIDFKRGELTVLEYARVTGDGDTKTVDSRRTLQFDEETGVALLAHKAMQEAEAEQAGTWCFLTCQSEPVRCVNTWRARLLSPWAVLDSNQ